MSAPEIKGWCPGARRPMMSGDGLVVRLRPQFGQVNSGQLSGVAALSKEFGTGAVDVTNRANLQIRGVFEQDYDALIARLDALSLLRGNEQVEGRLNIIIDPFHEGEGSAALDIAARLEKGLSSPEFEGLPSKFGFVVDTGSRRRLADASGDIRIELSVDGLIVRADGLPKGVPVATPDEAATVALDMAQWFLASGGVGSDGRGRMASHVTAATLPAPLTGTEKPNTAGERPKSGSVDGGFLVGAAFGSFTAEALQAIAEVATSIRLTPWRMVFLPGVDFDTVPDHPDLVIVAGDPRLSVAACVGAPHCPQSSVRTREIARQIAMRLAARQTAHVSGCAKGCAKPGPADLTLVGNGGAFDLVRKGAAWDRPSSRGLDVSHILALIES